MRELPKRSDAIYKEIESFEDYELTNNMAYEMAIRNSESKIIISKLAYINTQRNYIFKN